MTSFIATNGNNYRDKCSSPSEALFCSFARRFFQLHPVNFTLAPNTAIWYYIHRSCGEKSAGHQCCKAVVIGNVRNFVRRYLAEKVYSHFLSSYSLQGNLTASNEIRKRGFFCVRLPSGGSNKLCRAGNRILALHDKSTNGCDGGLCNDYARLL